MPTRSADARWEGDLQSGSGTMRFADFEGPFTAKSRFEDEGGATNPEELIAAAHAGCFSMALAVALEKAGTPPTEIRTESVVTLEPKEGGGWSILRSDLNLQADVPGLDEEGLRAAAEQAKQNCPVSKALQGNVEITLDAALES